MVPKKENALVLAYRRFSARATPIHNPRLLPLRFMLDVLGMLLILCSFILFVSVVISGNAFLLIAVVVGLYTYILRKYM